MLESLLKKVSRNKKTPAQAFSWELCEALKSTFFTEHFRWRWSLFLQRLYIVGFYEKVFERLVANEFLSNGKNNLHYISNSFLHFQHNLFFLLISFSTPHHGQRSIIKKWPPKGVFVDLLEKYLGMNAGLWSSVCVWPWIFKSFFEDFCDVCERRSVWNCFYYK